jgi:hypothetical protein
MIDLRALGRSFGFSGAGAALLLCAAAIVCAGGCRFLVVGGMGKMRIEVRGWRFGGPGNNDEVVQGRRVWPQPELFALQDGDGGRDDITRHNEETGLKCLFWTGM